MNETNEIKERRMIIFECPGKDPRFRYSQSK